MPLDESKKDFWDSFAEAGTARQNAVGTSAIKKNNAGGASAPLAKGEEDNWDKW
jgi:ADP-ribosylation factor GTPase-activating protein 1